MLEEQFNKLMTNTRLYTDNPVLMNIKKEWLSSIDQSTDEYVINMKNTMMNELDTSKIEYSDQQEGFYNDYSEVTLYLHLKNKGLDIKRVYEQTDKTPDFSISYGNETIYVENKCIKPMNPKKNIKDYQHNVLNSNIELAEKSKVPGVHMSEPICYPPYLPNDTTKYKSQSNLIVIHSLIEKVNQNLKRGQIDDNTVVNIDLTLLGLNSIPTTAAFIYDTQDDLIINAPLWASCFGRMGMPIFKYEFAPHGNFEGYLQQEGILISNSYLNAISFRLDKWSDPTFYGGFVRTMKDGNPDYHDLLEDFLEEYCNELNTDHNNNYECFRQ